MNRIENRLRHMDLTVCHEAADEVERLREENERLKQRLVVCTVNENRKLQGEVERLRGLLRECQDYVEAGMSSVDSELCDRIEKEVGDG